MQSRGHHLLSECVAVGADPQPHLHTEIHACMHTISGKSEVIRGHQTSSEVIRSHQRASVIMSGHQRSLVAITCSRNACKRAIGPLRLSD